LREKVFKVPQSIERADSPICSPWQAAWLPWGSRLLWSNLAPSYRRYERKRLFYKRGMSRKIVVPWLKVKKCCLTSSPC